MAWYFLFSYKKALLLRNLGGNILKKWKSVEKCDRVWKSTETILPFSCCPLVFSLTKGDHQPQTASDSQVVFSRGGGAWIERTWESCKYTPPSGLQLRCSTWFCEGGARIVLLIQLGAEKGSSPYKDKVTYRQLRVFSERGQLSQAIPQFHLERMFAQSRSQKI